MTIMASSSYEPDYEEMTRRLTYLGSYVAGWVVYKLVDEGVTNTLALKTLRHGTNLLNYLQIRVFGGDPKQGGKNWSIYDSDCEGYFYMLRDDDYNDPTAPAWIPRALLKRLEAKSYAFYSGAVLLRGQASDPTFDEPPIQRFLAIMGEV